MIRPPPGSTRTHTLLPYTPLFRSPVGRRVRLPRPAAGHDGDAACRAEAGARPPAAVRGAPVRRRRRAALVASAAGPRRAHALLGRLPVAAARDLPLRRGHRRSRGAQRTRDLPRRPPGRSGRGVVLRPAVALGPARNAVPALRARAAACAERQSVV